MRKRVTARCRRESCAKKLKRSCFIYCSVKCQQAYQYEQYIAKWLAGIINGSKAGGEDISSHVRRYVMETGGFQCSVCG